MTVRRRLLHLAAWFGLAASVPVGAIAGSRNSDPNALPVRQDIVEKVRHKLVSLPYYSLFDNLAYRVDGDTVTLVGEVTQPVLKSDAEHAVKHIEGVTQVVNQIKVLPLSPFDNDIRREEYRAIFGYAGLYRYGLGVNPSIHIIVDNGHVTLMGIVSTDADKNLVGIRANGVPGVFSVVNNLQVVKS